MTRRLFDQFIEFLRHVSETLDGGFYLAGNVLHFGIRFRTAGLIADSAGQLLQPLQLLALIRTE